MIKDFHTLLGTCVETWPARYLAFSIEIDPRTAASEQATLYDLDAALCILATELYDLRPQFHARHIRGEPHALRFDLGQYNLTENTPRLQDFARACMTARNKRGALLEIGNSQRGEPLLIAEDTSDLFDLVCHLMQTERFKERCQSPDHETLAVLAEPFSTLCSKYYSHRDSGRHGAVPATLHPLLH